MRALQYAFDEAISRLHQHDVEWLVPVSTDDPGTPVEQTKTKIADPSGNVIELKTYADVAAALDVRVESVAPRRAALIAKGIIYSPAHGDTAFTVPLFDDFLKRVNPQV